MRFFATILTLLLLASQISSFPLLKRFYQPTSPIFSLIAVHKGAQFQYNLVKFDGTDLKLVADDMALFGRIKANNGYVLNIPSTHKGPTSTPSTTNVLIDKDCRLTTTNLQGNSTEDFGIEESLLTYNGSNKFLACPDFSYRGEYDIYFNNDDNVECPGNATGYDIALLVQIDATINYSPKTNRE